MGCKYACCCDGMCGICQRYKSEKYVGHAEDFASELFGYKPDYPEPDYPEPDYPEPDDV